MDDELSKTVIDIWNEHLEVARASQTMAADVSRAAEMISKALARGGKLMLAGNGGSAADAQHIAAEFTGRFAKERRPLPALALHGNGSALTAVANDYGYDQVFARELSAHARNGDIFVAISTSGNSPNVVRAIHAARERGVEVIGLTGGSGGQMKGLCDLCLCVPSHKTARVQEMHILIGHVICQLIDDGID